MAKKKMILTLDVETVRNPKNSKQELCYDIGWVIAGKDGNPIQKRSFIISEYFDDEPLMALAFYAHKRPLYLQRMKEGVIIPTSFSNVLEVLREDVENFKVNVFNAYNCAFDTRALKTTFEHQNPDHELLYLNQWAFLEEVIVQKPIQIICTYNLAVKHLSVRKSYIKTAVDNLWVTEKGNIRTGAEYMYRYISGQHDFEEEHTGLEDAIIEAQILAKIFALRTKLDYDIGYFLYKITMKVAEQLEIYAEDLAKRFRKWKQEQEQAQQNSFMQQLALIDDGVDIAF